MTDAPRELLEELLGHQIGNAVERAYRRTDGFKRRIAVMQSWANFCTGRRSGNRRVLFKMPHLRRDFVTMIAEAALPLVRANRNNSEGSVE